MSKGKYPRLNIVAELQWSKKRRVTERRRRRVSYSSLANARLLLTRFCAAHPDCIGGTVGNRKGTTIYATFTATHTEDGFSFTLTKQKAFVLDRLPSTPR